MAPEMQWRTNYQFMTKLDQYHTLVSASRRSRDIKIPLCLKSLEKFNIVSNNHGRTQKCDFCASIDKSNFADHHTTYKINSFMDSSLICRLYNCYCAAPYPKISSITIPSHQAFSSNDASDCNG